MCPHKGKAAEYATRYQTHAAAAVDQDRYRVLGIQIDLQLDGRDIDVRFLEAVERLAGCSPSQAAEYRWAVVRDAVLPEGTKTLEAACDALVQEVLRNIDRSGN